MKPIHFIWLLAASLIILAILGLIMYFSGFRTTPSADPTDSPSYFIEVDGF